MKLSALWRSLRPKQWTKNGIVLAALVFGMGDAQQQIGEAALVRALADKRIAGAGLDVFENEPNVPRALFELDNVVLLPHIASATRETRQAMADCVLANLRSWFDHGRVLTPVA